MRRQFAIPAPFANPGANVPLSKWEWPTLNVDLRVPRLGLRAAAGVLLAATLWGAAGLLVVRHTSGGGPRYAMAQTPQLGNASNPDLALARMAVEFARPGSRFEVTDEQAAASREAELWAALEGSLVERHGQEMSQRVARLRESERVELLAVAQSFAENESLVMVTARVEGNMTIALIESTPDVSRLRLPENQRSSAGESAAEDAATPLPRLFRGRVSDGIAYEMNATGPAAPLLVPLLFEGAPMRALMTLEPERMRAPMRIAADMAPR